MRLIGLILAAAAIAAAQGVDGVNVSVSRVVSIAPDQAEFVAVAAVSLDTTQQQVLAAFQELGIASPAVTSTVVGVNNYSYPPPDASQLYFQASFAAAPSALKDLSKKLDAFRATPPAGFSMVQYAAALTASPSAIEAARQTILPLLLGDARSRAQTLAAAAGIKLGAVTGATESYYGGPSLGNAWYALSSAVLTSGSTTQASQYTFFVSVKFAAQ